MKSRWQMSAGEALSEARRLAVAQADGRVLTPAERSLVNEMVNEVSPENFYMDGELFA